MKIVPDATRRETHNVLLIAECGKDQLVLGDLLAVFSKCPVLRAVQERQAGDLFCMLRLEEIE